MSGTLLPFLIFKAVFVAAVLGFAVRELVVVRRPDSDPEFTRRLLHVFAANPRAVPAAPGPYASPIPPVLKAVVELPAEREAPRRAA
jgi:hypothetical protein